jgi:4-hydroxyphenylpyruvate dioxygenase
MQKIDEENSMGPFPHDAPPATDQPSDNPPAPTASNSSNSRIPRPGQSSDTVPKMGYMPVAKHKTKAISVWRQGDINYIVNAEPGSHAMRFVQTCTAPAPPRWAGAWSMRKHAFETCR